MARVKGMGLSKLVRQRHNDPFTHTNHCHCGFSSSSSSCKALAKTETANCTLQHISSGGMCQGVDLVQSQSTLASPHSLTDTNHCQHQPQSLAQGLVTPTFSLHKHLRSVHIPPPLCQHIGRCSYYCQGSSAAPATTAQPTTKACV